MLRITLAIFVLWSVLFCETDAAEAERPNIVVILVDDMGYGDPGCYNAESKILTPNIDALAQHGMKFTDAHASGPLCHISRYGLMTGQYPFRGHPGRWATQPTIDEDRLTVPAMLQQVGYRTEMVGKWHLGFQENGYDQPLPGGPVDRGFDHYFGIRASTDIPPYFYIRNNRAIQPPTDTIEANNTPGWSPIQGEFWRAGGIAPNLQLKDVLPRFTQEAASVMRSHGQQPEDERKPLMLYLAYPAPHTPWLPSPEFRGKSKGGLYGDFAEMVDDQIGTVLQTLEDSGLAEDTLVIFSSDNGPVWYQDDVDRFQHDCVAGLRGMKSDAWEGGHRMPFIVRWPGHVAAGSTADNTVSFVDVMATLSDLLDVPLSDHDGPDSFSFASVLTGRPQQNPERSDLVLHSGGGFRTIRSGPWKLIDRLGSGGFSQPRRETSDNPRLKGQLYNLETDRGETTNLYLERPEIVKRLTMRMKQVEDASGHRHVD